MKEITQPVAAAPMAKHRDATDFSLEIPDAVFQKVMWWINKSDHEVSGFGSLEFFEEENTWRVKDVILIEQEVGPTSTEICPKALGKAMYRMKDEPFGLKWHWHSHVNMGVFWSQDDRELIRSLGQQGWILATVFNKKKENKTAFMTSTEVLGRPHDLFVDDIPTHVQRYLDADLVKAMDAEYDANVKPKTYAPYPSIYNHYSDNEYEGWREREDLPNVRTLDEMRWMKPTGPVIEEILEGAYDEYGFAKHEGQWVYNPVYDKETKTEDEKFLMISEMEADEISYLRARCPKFERLLYAYKVGLITQEAPTTGVFSEAEIEAMAGRT